MRVEGFVIRVEFRLGHVFFFFINIDAWQSSLHAFPLSFEKIELSYHVTLLPVKKLIESLINQLQPIIF